MSHSLSFLSILLSTLAIAVANDAPPLEIVKLDKPLPIPSAAQLKYQGSISALIHFGMATFFHDGDPGCTRDNWLGCDPNGGCNSSNPLSFNPTNLNVSSWFDSMKMIGATSAVLTAKHGCGFLLYETNTTLPDGSPYRYHVNSSMPVMKLFVEAAEASGIGHGFYYSLTNNFYLNELGHNVQPPSTLLPGQASVTQAQYQAIALAQMEEIWTQFGNMTEIWLDGGCGEMCDDVEALIPTTLAKYAVAFNGGGVSNSPVRWCGTEGGNPSKGPGGAVWSTTNCSDVWCGPGSGSGSPPDSPGNVIYYPSGVDVTLQSGDHWFFMPNDSIHSLSDLAGFYHNSVGANGHLEIDFAIDRTGGIDPVHAEGYRQFGNWINSCYGDPIATGSIPNGANTITVTLPGGSSGSVIDRVSMVEDQTNGQNVINYIVQYLPAGSSNWQTFSQGTTIGSKRIDIASAPVTATSVRLSITLAYSTTLPVSLSVFNPDGCSTN